jgi:hypothetical protein
VLVLVGLIITKGPFSYSFNLVSKIRSVKGTITGASARTFDFSGTNLVESKPLEGSRSEYRLPPAVAHPSSQA